MKAPATRLLFAAILGLSILGSVSARAQEPDARRRAAELFKAGASAEEAGKFREAAVAYADADLAAPSDEALGAALDMALRADDPPLAMDLADRGRARGSASLNAAIERIRVDFGRRAGRVVVRCDGCTATLDGQALRIDVPVWTTLGPHRASLSRAGLVTNRVVEVGVEAITVVELPPPPAASAAATPRASTTPAANSGVSSQPGAKPLSPIVFIVAAGASAVLAGVTIWSALDVKGKHDAFVADGCEASLSLGTCRSQSNEGAGAETRTNVLIATTGGALVVTSVLGLFFVDWGRSPAGPAASIRVSPTLGGVTFDARF